MNRGLILAAAAAIGIAASAMAAGPEVETKKDDGPKPSPEVEKLAYFVGPWMAEGEFKQSPGGPGGPFTGREVCRWMAGNFFLGCMMQTKAGDAMTQTQGVLGYDTDKKVYLYWSFNNLGQAETATGTLKDGTWTWLGEVKSAGKTTHSRYTMSDTSPEGYASRWESSPDGKTWTVLMTGKVTRPKAPPTPTPKADGVKPPVTKKDG